MLKADALHFLNLVCLTLKKKNLDHYLLNKGKLKTAITATSSINLIIYTWTLINVECYLLGLVVNTKSN